MEKQITVLIVDDEPAGRETLAGLLYSQDYQLVLAENGQQAYEKAIEFMPDLILLDVMMPQMDGFQVCRWMRSDPLLAEVPIVIVTALDDRESRLKGIESGADDFISKPYDRIELRARIRTITRLNRYRRLMVERARFAWVVDQAEEGYVILDDNDTILYANAVGSQYLGIPADAYEGISFLESARAMYQLEPEENWQRWPEMTNLPYYLIMRETDHSNLLWLKLEVLQLELGPNSKTLVRMTNETESISLRHEMHSFHRFISHKLRTPMAQVVMAATLLESTLSGEGEVSEDAKVLLEALEVGANRLRDEIDDIVGHVDHTHNALPQRSLLGVAEMKTALAEVCAEMEMPPLEMDMNVPEGEGLAAPIAKKEFKLILHEVLENSVKFHPKKTPEISVKLVRTDQGMLRVTVQDDGRNLSPEQLSRIWTPYYQAEKVFTGEVEGMGLGLSTVAHIIWNIGGKCRIRNREGQLGVVVELDMPAEVLETAQR